MRYVEENSGGGNEWSHGHHHHNKNKKLKDDSDSHDTSDKRSRASLELDAVPNGSKEDKVTQQRSVPRKVSCLVGITKYGITKLPTCD